MIRLNKSRNIPAKLLKDGVTARRSIEALYSTNATAYQSRPGIKNRSLLKFNFDNSIYGARAVKDQLIHEQHEKCCFCEGKFLAYGHGDVEHFRPKAAYKKNGDRTLTYPGYYWLVYDWDNLMFSCQVCNEVFKKNIFPLFNESTRKSDHLNHNDIRREDRMLIDPVNEDPAIFVTFKSEVPVPRSGITARENLKAKTSIKVYGLDRDKLNNDRLEHIKMLKGIITLASIRIANRDEWDIAKNMFGLDDTELQAEIDNAREIFNSAARDNAKFALAVRENFPQLPV